MMTPADLIALCKGDVARLPLFVVHPTGAWVTTQAVPDSMGRIHLSDRTFAEMSKHWPFVQVGRDGEFSIIYRLDVQPHHVQGSADRTGRLGRDQGALRALVGRDPVTGGPRRPGAFALAQRGRRARH